MLGSPPPGNFQYPAPDVNCDDKPFGLYPIDFLLEAVLEAGIEWFISTESAPNQVFGHLNSGMLKAKYGQAKIDEIANFIKKYEITVVQHFSLAPTKLPSISIQLMDASETTERSGLADHERMVDVLNSENEVVGRSEVSFTSVSDSVHIGIHTEDSPDLAKYLYYLVVYLLNIFKADFQQMGVYLGTYSATDLSRLNDYLPENIYSRFINFQVWTIASVDRGSLPILEKIMGLSLETDPSKVDVTPIPGEPSETGDEPIELETGLTVCDIRQSDDGG